MAQDSLSSTVQFIGNPGPLTFTWSADDGTGVTSSISLNPALARMTTPQFSPIQVVNEAVSGRLHVFILCHNERLQWTIDVHDLPWDDVSTPPSRAGSGYRTLSRFVRYTLNYSEQLVQVLTPDGDIELMRYLGGLDTFREAEGQGQRANTWTGTLHFARHLATSGG